MRTNRFRKDKLIESGETFLVRRKPHHQEMIFNNARFIGYVVDALALAGDEGRGKLR